MSNYNLGVAAGKILIDGSGAVKGFGVAGAAANAFYAVVQSKLDSIDKLGTSLTKIGITGTAGLGLAVKTAASFEAGLSGVKAVSGATTEEMEKLRKKALSIGKDTSFSAKEAVDAISELSKAGVSTTDILSGAADATVALAAAGELDLPRAAEIASSAINNFALSGKELPHVADLIAGAANASAIDVGDFGFSLSQAGAVANLTGLKFDDLAVAIAEMGQAGIKGSDAGTSIKTFLTNLIPTTDKQKTLFEELGLQTVKMGADFSKLASKGIKPASRSMADVTVALEKYVEATGGAKRGTVENSKDAAELGIQMGIVGNAFFDATGKMVPFKDIQGKLSDATKGLSKEQKLMALDTLFGSDAIRASAVFANQGAEGFDKMAGAIGKVKAADVAKTRLDNLNGSIEQLKGSFETMQIIIGEVFLPIVRKFVDALNSLISVFLNLPEPVQKTIAIFIGLGSVMSLFTGIAIKLAFALVPMLANFLGMSALKGIFSIFATGFKVWRGGAGAAAVLGATVGRATFIFTRFAKIGKLAYAVLARFPALLAIIRTASTLAFGPWGIALAAVVAATIIAYKKIKPFHDLVNDIASTVKGAFVDAINFAKLALHALAGSFIEGDVTSDGFIGKVETLGSKLHLVLVALQNLVKLFNTNVLPALRAAGEQIKAALGDAFDSMVKTFRENVIPALAEVKTAFEENEPAIRRLWEQIQPLVQLIGKALVVELVGLFVIFVKVATFLIGTLIPAIVKFGGIYLVGLIGFISAVVNGLIIFVATMISVAQTIGGTIVGAFKLMGSIFTTVINGIVAVAQGFGSLVLAAINALVQSAISIWRDYWGLFGGVITAVFNLVVSIIQLAGVAILVAITTAIDTAYRGWMQLWNAFTAVVQAVWGAIAPYVLGAINALVRGMVVAYNVLKAATAAAWRLIKSYIVTPITEVVGFLGRKLAAAMNVVRNAWNTLVSITRAAFNRFFGATKSGTDKAMSPIKGIRSKVIGALSGAGSWLVNAGRAIIRGLINGINSATSGVRDTLNNLTNLIPDWKGPMTTDKVLLKKNGEAIMEGLIKAVASKEAKLKQRFALITRLIKEHAAPINLVGESTKVAVGAGFGNNALLDHARAVIGRDAPKPGKPIAVGPKKSRGPHSEAPTYITNYSVYNPVAEKTSVTSTKLATKRAALGVLG